MVRPGRNVDQEYAPMSVRDYQHINVAWSGGRDEAFQV